MHHAHVARHDDVLGARTFEFGGNDLVGVPRVGVDLFGERKRLDARGRRALEARGRGTARDNEHDLGVERTCGDAVDEGLEVGAGARDEYADLERRELLAGLARCGATGLEVVAVLNAGKGLTQAGEPALGVGQGGLVERAGRLGGGLGSGGCGGRRVTRAGRGPRRTRKRRRAGRGYRGGAGQVDLPLGRGGKELAARQRLGRQLGSLYQLAVGIGRGTRLVCPGSRGGNVLGGRRHAALVVSAHRRTPPCRNPPRTCPRGTAARRQPRARRAPWPRPRARR